MLAWRWVKRHAAIPALAFAIFVVAYGRTDLFADKEKGTFELVDMQGDRSAIEDVVFGGDLGDKVHHTTFAVDGGKVGTHTVLETAPSVDINRRIPGFGEQIGEWRYEVHGAPPFEINRYNGTAGGTVTVHPNITEHGGSANSHSYMNSLEYGIANIGERVFFVVPTTKDYTGKSAIYELDYASANKENNYRGEARELVPISLERNEQADEPNTGIQVFGLEAVGDTLVLLLEEDGKLVFRGYDSLSGEPIGEVVGEGLPAKALMNDAYRAFVDEDENVLNVRFDAKPAPIVYSIGKTDEGLKLLARTELDQVAGMEDRDYYNPSIMAVSFRNGKLYVAKTVTEIDEASGYTYRLEWPRHLFLEAYREGSLLYRGELRTDVNDDSIRMLSPIQRDIGYSIDDNRQFGSLRIENPDGKGL
ncbi:hypothetical protein [Cohnella sp. GCM10027633]|uniref:hypothetical protein n=1 Tax=unclassified Cohnella TaxID=2636738 RepID=UPI00362809F4